MRITSTLLLHSLYFSIKLRHKKSDSLESLNLYQAAKDIGLNMLSFHRGMGQENVLDAADELGILYYAEPGGYTSGRKQRHGANDFTRDWVSEKWLRMVKAMRNHPSLVIYNMINEQADDPDERNHLDMKLAHKIDPSRPMTYVSGWVTEGVEEPQKLHMLPFDTTQYHYGWFDFHHARGWGSLQDLHYRTPSTFFLNSTDEEEIVFYGEEGAIAVPPLLEKAVQHYNQTGKDGWDGAAYKTWLQAYKDYFNKKGWFTYYPTIDGLIEQMGELSHYYQGRIIENVRISNVIDGYAVNGYECERNENHSGVVDVFRNPKTDPDLMSYYAQTLYIALKARNKIEQAGENAIIDAFAVNELDLQGKHTLKISFSTPQGSIENLGEFHVELSGGDVFGELIQEAIDIPLKYGAGRYNVFAELLDENNKVRATGKEDIFVVDVKGEIPDNGAVIDIAGLTNGFLKDLPVYNAEAGKLDYLLLAQGTEEYSEIPSEILQTVDGKTGGVMLEIYKDEKQKELGQTLFSPRIRYDEMTYPFKEALNLKPELSIRFVGYLTPEITGTYQLEISHNWVTRLLINDEKVMEGKNSVAGGKDGAKPVDYYFEAGKKYKVELISEKPFGRPFTHAAFKWKAPQKAYDIEELLKRVENDGTNLVVIHSPESVLKALAGKGTIKYNGNLYHDHSWKGGIYFNKPHDIFKDLPQNVPFNWEYQVFTRYFGPRHRSFLLEGEEAIVASVAGHQHKVGTALGVIEYGKGKVIFSTLDIAPHLNSEETPALVAKKLLINLLRYASKR